MGTAPVADYLLHPRDEEAGDQPKSRNDRFRIGAIGMHNRGTYITRTALPFGDVVAIADVDGQVAERAKADFGGKADLYEDYRALLDHQDVDAVMIASPDHWHTTMAKFPKCPAESVRDRNNLLAGADGYEQCFLISF
ncbi:MAG: Gfo/Idh/MocA family oxidoreductase [Planctomycetota bacterium]